MIFTKPRHQKYSHNFYKIHKCAKWVMEEADEIYKQERTKSTNELENFSAINRNKHQPILKGREPRNIL
jgi:hypothetical protein